MPGRGNRRFFTLPPSVVFVGAEQATTPPSAEPFPGTSNSTLTIPVPSGVVDGDILLAVLTMGIASGSTITSPVGWFTLLGFDGSANPKSGVMFKYAVSEPASYTWTTDFANQALSGVIIAFRNAEIGSFVSQLEPNTPGDHNPRIAPGSAGGAFLAGYSRSPGTTDINFPAEEITASAPLILAEQHTGVRDPTTVCAAFAYELGLDSGELVSGRHMTNAAGPNTIDTRVMSIILRPAGGADPVSPVVVASSQATTPPSQGNDAGNLVVIPAPAGVVSGDHMFAAITSAGSAHTPPTGWVTYVASGPPLTIWYHQATASEPASYTWTAGGANQARSACMIAIRGGQVSLNTGGFVTGSAAANVGTGAMACPATFTGAVAGGLWLGFVGRQETDNDEDFTVTGTHTLQVQHSGGNGAGVERSCAISYQSIDVPFELIGGNVFVDAEAGGNRRTAYLLIEPI